jgi:hypothetical protein
MLKYREKSLLEDGLYISRSSCYGEYLGKRGNRYHDIIFARKFSLAACATPPSKNATFDPCNSHPSQVGYDACGLI